MINISVYFGPPWLSFHDTMVSHIVQRKPEQKNTIETGHTGTFRESRATNTSDRLGKYLKSGVWVWNYHGEIALK